VLTADFITSHDDLREVPTYDAGGRRLFYGRGPVSWEQNTSSRRIRNPYSDYGCYFLTEDDSGTPAVIADSTEFLNSFYPAADDYHSLHEVDDFSWYHGGRNLFEKTPLKLNESKVFTLANKAYTAAGRLTVAITTGTYASTVKLEANGRDLGEIRIAPHDSFDKGYEEVRSYALDNLRAVDSIKITTTAGGPARLDYIAMTYPAPAPAPSLKSNFPVPEYVYNITNQDHHADGPADMVIIIPTSQKLLEQAERLADFHRTHDNITVRIVPADELYASSWDTRWVNPFRSKNIPFPDSFRVDCSSFVCPVGKRLKINSDYGIRRRWMHRGIDLDLNLGDTVRAAFSGKVRIKNFERGGYGNYLVIRHPNGLETVYGHLSGFLVSENQIVLAGQPIGLGGSTGRSTGPHLHFETRFLGEAFNPHEIINDLEYSRNSLVGYTGCIYKIRSILENFTQEALLSSDISTQEKAIEERLKKSDFFVSLNYMIQKYFDKQLRVDYVNGMIGFYMVDENDRVSYFNDLSDGEKSLLTMIF